MLFTDGPFISADDLNVIDGEFSRAANANGVSVDASDNSLLSHSILGAGTQLISQIQSFSGYLVAGMAANSNHVAAVLNIFSTAINRPRALLHQIPVKEPDITRTALLRWIKFYVLHDFYRSIFRRSLADRFQTKMLMYEEETKKHWETLKGTGFPVILSPLSCPAAHWEFNTGTWTSSNLSAVAGTTQVGATYDVAITYCTLPAYQSPTRPGNGESAGSTRATIVVPDNKVIRISIASLNPPDGTMQEAIGTAQGVYPPMPATHWNVYAGPSGGTLTLQNQSPLPIAQKTMTFSDVPSSTGTPLSAGQCANYDFTLPNMLWRA